MFEKSLKNKLEDKNGQQNYKKFSKTDCRGHNTDNVDVRHCVHPYHCKPVKLKKMYYCSQFQTTVPLILP